ncbi:MAG: hypothetical protein J7M19_09615 [Planctomycetes bacterium]|nr:hypothetical protein [Planctomycetota bacterium]
MMEGKEVRFISNFRDEADVCAFKVSGARAEWAATTEDGALIEGVAMQAEAVKGGSLHLVLLPGDSFTTLEYTGEAGMPSDWSGFDTFVMNFDCGFGFMVNVCLALTDGRGREYSADNLSILRSRNRVEVPLSEAVAAGGEALDLSDVRRLALEIRSAEKFERDIWLFQFHLARAAAPVVKAAEDVMLFDFGPLGSRVMPGARLVTEKTAYEKWRGYGWTEGAEAVTTANFRKLDSLIGDWAWADLDGGEARLRVDIPDGKYKGRFYGGNYNSKVVAVRSFELSANGARVAGKAVDPETYYTTEGHFAGMNEWYMLGEDPYEKHITPFYQKYDFDFEVTGGAVEFAWSGTLAAFGLLVAPDAGERFEEACRAVEDARQREFAESIRQPQAAGEIAVSREETERGFVVWSRPFARELGVFDVPTDDERNPEVLRLKAARGEREISAFTVTPLRDVGDIEIAVSDLAAAGGARIDAGSVEVRALKYMWAGSPATVVPWYLYPTGRAPGQGRVNRTFYLTLTVPMDAAEGTYEGTVTIQTEKGGSVEVPLQVTTRPFKLVADHPVSYSWWRASPYSLNYCLRYFLPEKADYFRALMEAEVLNLVAHGCNAYYFTPPILTGVDGEHVNLDFSIIDEEAALCLKHGLCGENHPGMIFVLPDVARHLMHETRTGDHLEPEDISRLDEDDKVEEFSDLFNARFLDVVRQLQDYFERKGLNVLIYASDEPRERNTNRWNRSLEDSITYCDLIHKNVPGTRIYVDPMRDENAGVDYLPLLDHVDVIGTHPWDQSARIVEHCRGEGRPQLWYFNAIVWDRYDFGYQVAAAGATGFWQWHFQWDLVPFLPFHPGFKWGATVPGPDGPLDRLRHEIAADGIDDYRYVATLQARIRQAGEAGGAATAVAAAEKVLGTLLEEAEAYPVREQYATRPRPPRDEIAGKTLDEWRDILAEHIIAIDAGA